MELLRTFCESQPFTLATYLTLQRALMRRFVARGGTPEEFCRRIAPAFRRKYGALLDASDEMARAA
jgi:hypothetical protein